MSRSIIIMVSSNQEQVESLKKYSEAHNCVFQNYSPFQWKEGLESNQFRQQVSIGLPALVVGSQPLAQGQQGLLNSNHPNVVPFPSSGNGMPPSSASVQKMEELELRAIENAIVQFNGNLTEAAKALGIGRATLYRRVKHFKIDPNVARKKRPAAA